MSAPKNSKSHQHDEMDGHGTCEGQYNGVECGNAQKKEPGDFPALAHISKLMIFYFVSLAIAALILAMADSIFSMLLAKEIRMESGSPNARPVTVDTCA